MPNLTLVLATIVSIIAWMPLVLAGQTPAVAATTPVPDQRAEIQIGTDIAGRRIGDRDPGVGGIDEERPLPEVALAHLFHRPRERRHDRRDGDAVDAGHRDIGVLEQPGDEDAELVRGPLTQRGQPPVVHEALAVEDTDGDVGVPNVEG